MKKFDQAVLITAYKNFDYLESLVSNLSKFFSVYIHIDTTSTEIKDREINYLNEKYECNCFAKYKCCWGGYNNLLAYIELLRVSHFNHHSYYHIISGEDIPVKPHSYFKEFFSNNNKIYISLNKANGNTWEERYKYYYPLVNKDPHKRINRRINSTLIYLQKLLKVNRMRIGQEKDIYKGYVFGSLPDDAVHYVLNYVDNNPIFLKDLSKTFIPEEFFFQTILGNSDYKPRIASDCLRYSVWEYKNGSIPGYLDMTDYSEICENNYLFARKVSYKTSKELINKLNKFTGFDN